jgi:predicted HicB family RNase H-like nuclease
VNLKYAKTRIPPTLHARCEEEAATRGWSLMQWLRWIIEREIRRVDRERERRSA